MLTLIAAAAATGPGHAAATSALWIAVLASFGVNAVTIVAAALWIGRRDQLLTTLADNDKEKSVRLAAVEHASVRIQVEQTATASALKALAEEAREDRRTIVEVTRSLVASAKELAVAMRESSAAGRRSA